MLRAYGASVANERRIVTICESGPRAAIAASVLVAAGVDAPRGAVRRDRRLAAPRRPHGRVPPLRRLGARPGTRHGRAADVERPRQPFELVAVGGDAELVGAGYQRRTVRRGAARASPRSAARGTTLSLRPSWSRIVPGRPRAIHRSGSIAVSARRPSAAARPAPGRHRSRQASHPRTSSTNARIRGSTPTGSRRCGHRDSIRRTRSPRIDLRQAAERSTARRTATTSATVSRRSRASAWDGVTRSARRRPRWTAGDRQRDRRAPREPDCGNEQLAASTARSVQVDDGRQMPTSSRRDGQVAVDAPAGNRVRDVSNGDRVRSVDPPTVVEAERLRGVIRERCPRRRRLDGRAAGASAPGGEEQRGCGHRAGPTVSNPLAASRRLPSCSLTAPARRGSPIPASAREEPRSAPRRASAT